MITVREYLDTKGNSPFAKWFARLNANAAAKVATAVYRMEQDNFSKFKVSVQASTSTGSISVRVIGSISPRTESCW